MMVRPRSLVVAALAASLALAAVASGEPASTVPAFSLPTPGGMAFDLAARKGQPLTAVVFFATWNPKSATALSAVQKIAAARADKGFAAVAVNAESETTAPDFAAQLGRYVAEQQLTLPVVMDEGLAVYRGWEVRALPTVFLLDADLKPIEVYAGAPTGFDAILDERVARALGLAPAEAVAGAEDGGRYRPERSVFLVYGMAEQLAGRGRESKALEKIEESLAADAKFPDAWALKGALLIASKGADQQKAAREAFAKAAELDATLPLALLGKAYFALADGDAKTALDLARTAVGQKNWGLRPVPDGETLAAADAGLSEAAAKLDAGDAANAKAALSSVLDSFLTLREKPKVKMRQLDQAAGK